MPLMMVVDLLNQTLNRLTQEQEVELAEHYPDMADDMIGWCYITEKYGPPLIPGDKLDVPRKRFCR